MTYATFSVVALPAVLRLVGSRADAVLVERGRDKKEEWRGDKTRSYINAVGWSDIY